MSASLVAWRRTALAAFAVASLSGVSLEQAAVGYEGSIDVAVPDMVIEVGA